MSGSGQSAADIEPQDRFVGKQIPASPFAGDNGQADPAVIAALQQLRAGELDRYAAVNVLAQSRLFVPVVAVLDSEEEDGHGHRVEKDSHMATVSVTGPNGERGLLAFTSDTALAAWSAQARPVAAAARAAAAAAIDEGADVMIIDAETDHTFIITTPGLLALAQGRQWCSPVEDSEVVSAVRQVLEGVVEPTGCGFELRPGNGTHDLQLVVLADPGALPDRVVAVAKSVAAGLTGSELLRARLSGGIAVSIETVKPDAGS